MNWNILYFNLINKKEHIYQYFIQISFQTDIYLIIFFLSPNTTVYPSVSVHTAVYFLINSYIKITIKKKKKIKKTFDNVTL